MPDEPFVMISLKGEKAKTLANVLSNKSASKILTYLANNAGVSESKIAKDLKLPISTVNYNMKALVEAKLVVADEYHYSSRGREVNHYRLARKYIIIAPDEENESFWDRVKGFVPVALIAAGVGVIIKMFGLLKFGGAGLSADALPQSAEMVRSLPGGDALPAAVPMAAKMVSDTAHEGVMLADAGAQAINETVNQTVQALPRIVHTAEPSFLSAVAGDWLGYFLLGIFVVTLAAMAVEYVRSKR